jgi:hypothetical protein
MRITYRHQKEAEPEGHHEDIKHEVLLSRLFTRALRLRAPGKKIAMDQER